MLVSTVQPISSKNNIQIHLLFVSFRLSRLQHFLSYSLQLSQIKPFLYIYFFPFAVWSSKIRVILLLNLHIYVVWFESLNSIHVHVKPNKLVRFILSMSMYFRFCYYIYAISYFSIFNLYRKII